MAKFKYKRHKIYGIPSRRKKTDINGSLTLYDINKQVAKQQKEMTYEQIQEITKELENWFNMKLDGYAMLLCRERYDFTIFHLYEKANPNPPAVATKELIELLKERGKLISISKNTVDETSWEIWVIIEDEPYCFYLFSCDGWVIQC